MARIVLTPMGSLGDLHPLLALGLGLAGRGHDAVFATSAFYREKIEALGFEFHPLRPEISPDTPGLLEYLMDIKKGPERVLREMVFPYLRETYDDLAGVLPGADFLVTGELICAAGLAASVRKLPWAFAALQPLSFFSPYDPPVPPPYPWLARLRSLGPAVNRRVMDFGKRVTRPWAEPVERLRRELGLPPAGHPLFEGKYSPHLNLALFSQVLGAPQPDWPARTVQAGFCFYDRETKEGGLPAELARFLEQGEPPVVFALGSSAVGTAGDFFDESAKAAAALGRRAVLVLGDNPPPPECGERILASRYAPYSELFPRAAAIVHQGGAGTCAQALAAGRPTLIVPWSHDQPDNAARLARLGTSRTILRKAYTAKRVARELRRLLDDPGPTAKAAEVARILKAEDGVRTACDAIEEVLRRAAHASANLPTQGVEE
jgi:rhamnosyltransferase subunit B